MPFIKPMLASPLPVGFVPTGGWFAEEKFDGHRLLVEVSSERTSLLHDKTVRAWSRDGLDRILPTHVLDAASLLPDGLYDGELFVPGKRSYGVTALANAGALRFVMFDVLRVLGQDCTAMPYVQRREAMDLAVRHTQGVPGVVLSESFPVASIEDVTRLAESVWSRDGEGLILKLATSTYAPGKRSKAWVKVKSVRSATLTVTGFFRGKLGECSVTALRDEDGNETTVKTKDTKTRELIAANPSEFLGRRLLIEYQERTPDRGYRHGMWDRWEDE